MTVITSEQKAYKIAHYLGARDIQRETLSSGRWYFQGVLEYNGSPNIETHKIDFGSQYSILKTSIHVVAKVIRSNSWGTTIQYLIALNPITHRFTILCNCALSQDMTLEQVDQELNGTTYWPVGERSSFKTAIDLAYTRPTTLAKIKVF
jgi:hypothetical protein